MKLKLIVTFLILVNVNAFSQEDVELKKLLENKYPREKGWHIANADWDYDGDSPKKIFFPIIQTYFPRYNFYSVALTFSFDTHIMQPNCVVLYDKEKNDLILVAPVLTGDLEQPFYKKMIGIDLKNESNAKAFAKEFGNIYLFDIESRKIHGIEFQDDLLMISTISDPYNGIDGMFRIFLDSFVIKEIQAVNPRTGEVWTSVK